MNPQVDEYIDKLEKWREEIIQLRRLVLDCGLMEELKWKEPCYTYQKKNILIISGFKEYCALNFFKGVLLNDSDNLLVKAGENSQSARQIRFTSVQEIEKKKIALKAYILEAVEVEKAGLQVNFKKTLEFEVPVELEQKFKENPELEVAFKNLTPGRQRGYLLHFSQPKQAKTRVARIEKNSKRILLGKGLNDCLCGHSKRMPSCDGSHNR